MIRLSHEQDAELRQAFTALSEVHVQDLRSLCRLIGLDLKRELEGLSFFNANFEKENLSDLSLADCNLGKADLSEADLSGADLSGAILSRAILSRAILRGADLRETALDNATLDQFWQPALSAQQINLKNVRWVGDNPEPPEDKMKRRAHSAM
jgi:uncharacterized protein YjbI with pentapeptide repeats